MFQFIRRDFLPARADVPIRACQVEGSVACSIRREQVAVRVGQGQTMLSVSGDIVIRPLYDYQQPEAVLQRKDVMHQDLQCGSVARPGMDKQ